MLNEPKVPQFLEDLDDQQLSEIAREVDHGNRSALIKDLRVAFKCEGRREGMSTLELLQHSARFPIRTFTKLLRAHGRKDVITAMKRILPNGVTGMK